MTTIFKFSKAAAGAIFFLLFMALNAQSESRYYSKNLNSETVVVFIHGILGNTDTWMFKPSFYRKLLGDPETYWPDLIRDDIKLDQPDTFIFEYKTSPVSKYYISDFASQLASTLVVNGVDEYENIVFIAHSMGGLVLKTLLTKNNDLVSKIEAKVKFVIFYGTPSTGSSVGELASYLTSNNHLEQMIPISSGDENRFLLELVENWAPVSKKIASYCVYEKDTFFSKRIVSFDSASNGCTGAITGITLDHFGIVKPENVEATGHTAFQAAYLTEIGNINNARPSLADIVAIDSYQYASVTDNDDPRETNADEIKSILVKNDVVSSDRVMVLRSTPIDWDAKVAVIFQPKLFFLHLSAFEVKKTEECNLDETFVDGVPPACLRLLRTIKNLLDGTAAQIVLYTRTPNACDNAVGFFKRAIDNGHFKREMINRLFILGLGVDGRKREGDKKWFSTEATNTAVAFISEIILNKPDDGNKVSWLIDTCHLGA